MSGRSQSPLVRFVNYARMGENDKLVDMLNSGQDANEANEAGFTALILAAREGKLDCVNTLLAVDNIQVNHQEKQDGTTAIMQAIMYGHSNIVQAMCDHGMLDLTIQSKKKMTALDYAIEGQELQCLTSILYCENIEVSKVDITKACVEKTQSVHLMDINILDIMLKAGCPVNGLKLNGSRNERKFQGGSTLGLMTPLRQAVGSNRLDMVERLFQEPAMNIFKCENEIRYGTPMIVAAVKGRSKMITLLSKNGFIIDAYVVNKLCRYGWYGILKNKIGVDIHDGAIATTVKYMKPLTMSKKDMEKRINIFNLLMTRRANANTFSRGLGVFYFLIKTYDALFNNILKPEEAAKYKAVYMDMLKKLNSNVLVNPNILRSDNRQTPLLLCMDLGFLKDGKHGAEVVEEFLKNPRIVLDKPSHIREAARSGNQKMLELLLNVDSYTISPEELARCLNVAIRKKYTSIIKMLFKQTNLDINLKVKSGETPLIEAIAGKDLDLVTLILSHPNIDVNARGKALVDDTFVYDTDDYGPDSSGIDDHLSRMNTTPLLQAILNKQTPIIKQLLTHPYLDVKKTLSDSSGRTPLYFVALQNNLELFGTLLKKGADPTRAVNYVSESVMHIVLKKKRFPMFTLILEDKDIDPNITNGNGETPLHYACLLGLLSCVKELSQHPNINMERGVYRDTGSGKMRVETPLFTACCNGHLDIAKFLLQKHVNETLIDPSNKRFTDRQALKKRITLEYIHASISTLNGKKDDTLLTIATFQGHRDVVQWLIDLGVDLDEPNSVGDTPVSIASRRGNTFLVKLLTNRGAHGYIQYPTYDKLKRRKQADLSLNRKNLPKGVRQHIGSFLGVKSKSSTLKF